jgi:hypothetical protein
MSAMAPIILKVMEAFRGMKYILKEFAAGVYAFFANLDWKSL